MIIIYFIGLVVLAILMWEFIIFLDNTVTPNLCFKCGAKCVRTDGKDYLESSFDAGWVCTACGSYFDALPLGPPI